MGIQLNGITGDITTPGDVGIGGTLTYEDVANVDSIGIVTARSGINVTGGNINVSSGSVTATSRVICAYSMCMLMSVTSASLPSRRPPVRPRALPAGMERQLRP